MTDQVTAPLRLSDLQASIARAQIEAKMDVLERTNERLTLHLQSIFDGIGRNEQVELIYPNGEVVLITKARKRDRGEGGE
ncbi:MAG: hypothetical protein E5V67_22820 [Mesorhizobium sp.]|nr:MULTISPECIES: hypothetical protein [unclassified Mesorhizobium]TGV90056.1 hypothetical protein EN801_020600 [Mesorhizobium sp. M00.F.Ca.ET.158.01.1.1]TKB32148.1 MAG: hypothetical protein E5V67_22820 [Mesorhizobium sp.]MDG4887616.1 hypothetical protein [Mesorhizobium sp. WSM4887]MDG4905964.1 hypothetical protein [Mesorhizobium sp. WSM4898]OBQ89973.1 hypothetical protein A9K66_15100 [Mesorhizobium sp. AA23]